MNLDCMLYLQRKGLLTSEKHKMLDIGPQNVYFAKEAEIRDFLKNQGISDISETLAAEIKKIEYFCTPRPEERTTMFSDITQLTNIEYNGFDICPAPFTEILDLNFDVLPNQYRNYYDVVLNFGTTEHVFNQWNSFEIIHDATKVGGVIYCVLPMSGYLDHGYYCYTPLFFEDMAKANGYETVEIFIAPAGMNDVKQMGLDVRHEKKLLEPHSAQVSPGNERVPQYNIHAILRKTSDAPFRATMEVATAHSAVDQNVAARYASGELVRRSTGESLPPEGDMGRIVAILDDLHKSHKRTADEFRTQREKLEKELSTSEYERENLISYRDRLVQETQALTTERDSLASQISTIRNSTSWKLAAPIRAIGRIFK